MIRRNVPSRFEFFSLIHTFFSFSDIYSSSSYSLSRSCLSSFPSVFPTAVLSSSSCNCLTSFVFISLLLSICLCVSLSVSLSCFFSFPLCLLPSTSHCHRISTTSYASLSISDFFHFLCLSLSHFFLILFVLVSLVSLSCHSHLSFTLLPFFLLLSFFFFLSFFLSLFLSHSRYFSRFLLSFPFLSLLLSLCIPHRSSPFLFF